MKLYAYEVDAIRKKVNAIGINKTAALLQIARGTLLGILAGADVQRGTMLVVRAAMTEEVK